MLEVAIHLSMKEGKGWGAGRPVEHDPGTLAYGNGKVSQR